jgi:hypothetical protein
MKEADKVERSDQHDIARLSGSLLIQADASQQRLALEWGQILLDRLLTMWMRLDAHEALAYEDKVAVQVQILEEATASLKHLHRTLASTHRRLHQHLRCLRCDVTG